MKDKKAKHTSDERAEELIQRFYSLNNIIEKNDKSGTGSYISKYAAVLCALEIAKENCYVHGWNGPCQQNTGHHSYWNRVKTYLENKLAEFES